VGGGEVESRVAGESGLAFSIRPVIGSVVLGNGETKITLSLPKRESLDLAHLPFTFPSCSHITLNFYSGSPVHAAFYVADTLSRQTAYSEDQALVMDSQGLPDAACPKAPATLWGRV
jgi:hypothetical protein